MMRTTGSPQGESRRRAPGWLIVGALSSAGLTAAFMYTLMVPLQPELPHLLSASREDTTWAVTITLLTACIATPIAGRLGDMYGKRRVVLVLLLLLIAGSAVAAFSASLAGIIVGRGLQGMATGVIPLGIAMMRDLLAPERLSTAIALMSATMGVGSAAGMPLAAYIASVSDWHMLFWVSAALGVLCFIVIGLWVPESDVRVGGRIDWVGILGFSVALTGILLFISRGASWGWLSPTSLICLGSALVVLLWWVRFQLRRADPLIDLRVATRPAVLFANLTGFFMAFAFFASNIALPQLLEMPARQGIGFGLTMYEAALCIAPAGMMMLVLSPLSGWLERMFGARALLLLGTATMGLAYAFLLLWGDAVWQLVLANAVIGAGIAFSFAAMPMIILRTVPPHETGVSNGLNSLSRSIGTSTAAALIGGVLTSMVAAERPTAGAFEVSFMLGLASAIVATALAAFVPKHPKAFGETALAPTN